MSCGWLHITVDMLPVAMELPDGTRAIKAEGANDGKLVAVLVEHPDIPDYADWINAIYSKGKDGRVEFVRWDVVPNTSADSRK